MAEVVVAFIVESLGDLLIQEAEALHGVSHQVEEIQDGLRSLQCFLKEAEGRQKEHDVRVWIADLRQVAYDASDVLETYIVNVASTKRRKGINTILHKYVCTINELALSNCNIRSRVQAVKTRISDLTTRIQVFGIRSFPLLESSSSSNNNSDIAKNSQEYYIHPVVDQQLVVGLDKHISDSVAHLVNNEKHNFCRVVGIYGMGGLGKTTLARKIYNHSNIKRHFACFAWICISQKWQKNDILREILLKLGADQKWDSLTKLSDKELVDKILEIQITNKCLVVLDDIWSADAWDCFKAAFPAKSYQSSKLLITTRSKQVAEHVAGSEGFLHQPKMLDPDQSWELLLRKTCINKIVGAGGSINVDKMEVLGREMLTHCNGLPLGILVLGGILATKPTLTEWERVHQTVLSHLKRGKGMGEEHKTEVLKMLELSYLNLPYHLKLCFLHLAQFPEDSEIEAEKLYQMWMAEGFVPSKGRRENKGETMLSVAERYLGELVHRSMVMVQFEEEESSFRKFKSCHLHDLMRDLSLQKADDENFFKELQKGISDEQQLVMDQSSLASTIYTRRVVIANGVEDIINRKDCFINNKAISMHMRSLISGWKVGEGWVYYAEKGLKTFLVYNLNSFKLLRVLSLEKLHLLVHKGQRVLEAIGKI